jgi:hypothetical protein
MYYKTWLAKSVAQSNQKGTWFGWYFEPANKIYEMANFKDIFKEAIDFAKDARDGLVKTDFHDDERTIAAAGNEAPF